MLRNKGLWCAVAMAVCAVPAAMAEDEVSVGVAADLFSKYVWRGQNIVDDWVLQPTVSAGYKGFTGSVWGNVDLRGDSVDDWEFSEVDYAIDYSNQFPDQETFGYSLGVIYYDFPNTQWDATSEVYGGLTAAWPLSPAVKWFYDFDEADGGYVLLSVGHTIEKIKEWREDCYCDVQVGASMGYGTDHYDDFYFGVDDGAINDLTLSVGVPFCIGSLTIKPSVSYSVMIDGDIREATDKSDNLWCGVGASHSF